MKARGFWLFAFLFSLSLGQAPARTPDVHYTPTRHAIADAMLQLAQVGPGDVVYDLGSGDGRIPIIAAQKYGARGVGIEIDPALVAQAKRNAQDAGVSDRVAFILGDLFTADLTRATVVTMYLSPNIMKRIEPGLRALGPGTRIVSHQFPMGAWAPDRRVTIDEAEILLWVVPGRDAHQPVAATSGVRWHKEIRSCHRFLVTRGRGSSPKSWRRGSSGVRANGLPSDRQPYGPNGEAVCRGALRA